MIDFLRSQPLGGASYSKFTQKGAGMGATADFIAMALELQGAAWGWHGNNWGLYRDGMGTTRDCIAWRGNYEGLYGNAWTLRGAALGWHGNY